MVLQEQSALPIENLRGEPCSGLAFRARRRAAKKYHSTCRFPPTSFDVQIERGISRSIPSGSPAPKYINHKEKLRCELLS
jgi:hypothetical protein